MSRNENYSRFGMIPLHRSCNMTAKVYKLHYAFSLREKRIIQAVVFFQKLTNFFKGFRASVRKFLRSLPLLVQMSGARDHKNCLPSMLRCLLLSVIQFRCLTKGLRFRNGEIRPCRSSVVTVSSVVIAEMKINLLILINPGGDKFNPH